MDLEKVSQAVKVLTLLAVLGTAKGQKDGEAGKEEEDDDLFLFLCIYTIAVILMMKLGQVLGSMAWAIALKIRERLAEGEDQQEVKKGKEPVSEESEEEVPIPRPKELELINKENGPRTTGASSTTMASSSNEAVSVASRLSSSTLTFEVLTTRTGLVLPHGSKVSILKAGAYWTGS